MKHITEIIVLVLELLISTAIKSYDTARVSVRATSNIMNPHSSAGVKSTLISPNVINGIAGEKRVTGYGSLTYQSVSTTDYDLSDPNTVYNSSQQYSYI